MKTKKTVSIAIMAAIVTLFTIAAKAQNESKQAELKVKTSAVCNMCAETLESNLALEKGIKRSSLDVKSAVLTVIYNPKKITPEKIRKAVSKIGYDADDIPADEAAYNKLNSCCKKDNKIHD